MAADALKFIAVKFDKMLAADEANLTAFIQREVSKKTVRVDEANDEVKKQREVFRVQFHNMRIKAVTEATQTLPQQEFDVSLEDISIGGCCIGMKKDVAVVKNGTIYLTLHFCQPPMSVRGTILGLRRN